MEALFCGNSDVVQEMEQRCRRGPPDAVLLWLLGLRFFLAATILVLDSSANELPNQEIEETKEIKLKSLQQISNGV